MRRMHVYLGLSRYCIYIYFCYTWRWKRYDEIHIYGASCSRCLLGFMSSIYLYSYTYASTCMVYIFMRHFWNRNWLIFKSNIYKKQKTEKKTTKKPEANINILPIIRPNTYIMVHIRIHLYAIYSIKTKRHTVVYIAAAHMALTSNYEKYRHTHTQTHTLPKYLNCYKPRIYAEVLILILWRDVGKLDDGCVCALPLSSDVAFIYIYKYYSHNLHYSHYIYL